MAEIEKYLLDIFRSKYIEVSEKEYLDNKGKDNYTYAYDEETGKIIYFKTKRGEV
jgi:hypothetical protein